LDRLMTRMATPAGLTREAWTVASVLGKPARTIIAFARTMSADLIVMGTNGRTGPARLFFGSVADAVLRQAPVPLLVVARRKPARSAQMAQARGVIGAIDLGEHAVLDARRMARAVAMMGGELTLVHVIEHGAQMPEPSPAVDAYIQRQLTAAQTRLAGMAKSVGARSRVMVGRPDEGIVAAATHDKANLIILALRKGKGIFGRRQGATTYRVLCSSTIPVLALPPAWKG
jgi:nucleotide-binding universal stress UspA family protein